MFIEHTTLHFTSYIYIKLSLYRDIASQIQAQKASSGVGILLQFIKAIPKDCKNCIIILDEPCRGLSPFWQERMKNMIINLSFYNQVIISTHSERIMDAMFATIYSVEHKKEFYTVEDFLTAHLNK